MLWVGLRDGSWVDILREALLVWSMCYGSFQLGKPVDDIAFKVWL